MSETSIKQAGRGRGGPLRLRPREWTAWARAGLVGACSVMAVAVSAQPAAAITYSQQTMPLTGLSYPYGVAVDGAGDVFVADYFGGSVDDRR